MTHHYDPEIEALKVQLECDLEVYKEEKTRFYRLEHVKDTEISEADRKAIVNWSRSSIREYNIKLDKLEAVEEPTPVQKEVMKLLNRLVMLSDELGDMFNTFVQRYQNVFGAADMMSESIPDDKYTTGDGIMRSHRTAKTVQKPKTPASVAQPSPKPVAATAPSPEPKVPVKEPTSSRRPDAVSEPIQAKGPSPQAEPVDESPSLSDSDDSIQPFNPEDPKGIYSMLGVAPHALQDQVMRAVKVTKRSLHPDRNLDDPEAAGKRFAEFSALVNATVATERLRQAYSEIETEEQLEELTNRVRMLAMDPANPGALE
ncbi:hypothetical protein LTR53_001797 [Teratosphaeriaceae sp. CCFEE 6253]|nr:hypothetical protein LTR53_001797 [Teratosphaeriaceae sp. CCFEE 6253]